jgi:hypothetical protein
MAGKPALFGENFPGSGMAPTPEISTAIVSPKIYQLINFSVDPTPLMTGC